MLEEQPGAASRRGHGQRHLTVLLTQDLLWSLLVERSAFVSSTVARASPKTPPTFLSVCPQGHMTGPNLKLLHQHRRCFDTSPPPGVKKMGCLTSQDPFLSHSSLPFPLMVFKVDVHVYWHESILKRVFNRRSDHQSRSHLAAWLKT